jgi:hypothetical protein
MKRPLALAIVSAVLLAMSAVASAARPRVALIKFDGDPGGEVQDLVSEAIDADTLVVGPKEVNRTVDKLGLSDDMSEKELKKLASELDADALVQGRIGKKGDNRIAHFKLFVHGKKKGFSVEFSNLKSEKLKQTVHDKMLEKIEGTPSGGGDDEGDKKAKKKKKSSDDEETADKPKKKTVDEDAGDDPLGDKKKAKKKAPQAADDEEAAPKKKAAPAEDEEAAALKKKTDDEDADKPKKKKHTDDEAAADDEDAPRKAKKRVSRRDEDDPGSDAELRAHSGDDMAKSSKHPTNTPAVRVDIGGSTTTRSLQFTSRNFDQKPNGYKNSPVPGVRLAGELYPFAFSNPKGAAAGFGIAGDFDKTVLLSLSSTAQPGTKFAVNENHWSVGARYRVPFGSTSTAPTLTLGASYGMRSFKVDRTQLQAGNIIDLPDVGYVAFMPGLEFRIPLGGAAAIFFGGRALLVTQAGAIQSNTEYGQAKITGGEGAAGFDILFGGRFALRLAGEFAQLGYAFTGTGMQTNNRDGDPSTKDVGGAADRYIGGAVTLGILY